VDAVYCAIVRNTVRQISNENSQNPFLSIGSLTPDAVFVKSSSERVLITLTVFTGE